MVFCTEFLDVWWSWEPLFMSCVRYGWCRASHCTIRTAHTTVLLKSLFVIYIRQWQNLINFLNYIFVKCHLKCTRIVVQCLWRSLDREIRKEIIWTYVKNCVNRGDWCFWHLSSRQRLTVLRINSQFNLELTCYFCKISYSNQVCSDISASDIYETDVCPV